MPSVHHLGATRCILHILAALLLQAPLAATAQTPEPPPVRPTEVPDPIRRTGGMVFDADTQHSLLDFTARHLGFGRVRGTFNDYRAAMYFTPDDLTKSTFRVVIDVASLDTQNPGRDDLLKQQFFAADRYPTITFTSRQIRPTDRTRDQYVMTGDLKIRDVSRSIEIPFEVITLDGHDQWQNHRLVLEGGLTINRNDFGVVYDNEFWDGIVSDSIRIDISFGAARYNAMNDIFPWRPTHIGTVIRDGLVNNNMDDVLDTVRDLYSRQRTEYDFSMRRFNRAARALFQAGRLEDAEDVYRFALDLHGEMAETSARAGMYVARAEIALVRGDPNTAADHVRTALKIDANHPGAWLMHRRLTN